MVDFSFAKISSFQKLDQNYFTSSASNDNQLFQIQPIQFKTHGKLLTNQSKTAVC